MHTHIRNRHAHMHTHRHTHIRTDTHVCTHIDTRVCMYTRTYTEYTHISKGMRISKGHMHISKGRVHAFSVEYTFYAIENLTNRQ
jgi:hypothetical protein